MQMGIWEQLQQLSEAFAAMLLAAAGDLLRQYHHQEQGGKKVGRREWIFGITRGAFMGVIAYSLADYLNNHFGVVKLLGSALGGVLGYMGPGIIANAYQRAVDYWFPPKG